MKCNTLLGIILLINAGQVT